MKKVALIWMLILLVIAYLGFKKDGLSFEEGNFLLMAGLVLIIQSAYKSAPNHNSESISVNEGESALFRILNTIGQLFIPIFAIAFTWFDFANYASFTGASLLGSIFSILGIIALWKTHSDLKSQFSPIVEIQEHHQLITTGIYRFARHPMYLSLYCITIAQVLLLNNWVAGPAGLVGFTLLYLSRVQKEETMLRDQFGSAYEAYCGKVGRLFPRLGRS